jgi:hypothetical protein
MKITGASASASIRKTMNDGRILERRPADLATGRSETTEDVANPKPALVAGKRCSPRVIAIALALIVVFLLFFYVRRSHDVSPDEQPLHQSR